MRGKTELFDLSSHHTKSSSRAKVTETQRYRDGEPFKKINAVHLLRTYAMSIIYYIYILCSDRISQQVAIIYLPIYQVAGANVRILCNTEQEKRIGFWGEQDGQKILESRDFNAYGVMT